jgi:hypothetical protein
LSRRLLSFNTRLGVRALETTIDEKLELDAFERRERDQALERVVDIWLNDERDPEKLDKALDVLTFAHTKATFDFHSQGFYFRLPWHRILKSPNPKSD